MIKRALFAAFHICSCHVYVWSVYYVNIGAKVNHTILKNAGRKLNAGLMHLPVTFDPLCCTNFKMTKIKIHNGYWQRPDIKCVNEKERKI